MTEDGEAPLTVVHADAGEEWRGGQRQVYLLAREMRTRGHRPVVAAPGGSPLARRLGAEGGEHRAWSAAADLDVSAAAGLSRIARSVGAEIVHAHCPRAHAAARLAGAPARFLPLIRPPRWRLVVTRRAAVGPRFPRLTRLKYGGDVEYVAISEAVADYLGRVGVPASRVAVVPSGVPSPDGAEPRPWRVELGLGSDATVAGTVAALSPEKGLPWAAEAWVGLRDVDVHWVVVGEGPERSALEEAVGRHGVEDRVHLVGWTDDPAAAIAGFDVYLQPSRREGLGTTAIQAMAAGKPLVVTGAGGLPEVVGLGDDAPDLAVGVRRAEAGLAVSVGDPDALARALRTLAGDPELRAVLGRRGRERARRLFSVGAMVEGTLGVYRRVRDRGGP